MRHLIVCLCMGIAVACLARPASASVWFSLDPASTPPDPDYAAGSRGTDTVDLVWDGQTTTFFFSVDRIALGLPGSIIRQQYDSGLSQSTVYQVLLPADPAEPPQSVGVLLEPAQLGLDTFHFGDDLDGLHIDGAPGPTVPNATFPYSSILRSSSALGSPALLSDLSGPDPDGLTPDDIIYAPPGGGPGVSNLVFASGVLDFGLAAGDAVDALALLDVTPDPGNPGQYLPEPNGELDPGFDLAIFSLDPFSPTGVAGAAPGPGALFRTSFDGTHSLWHGTDHFQLNPGENIDAISALPEPATGFLLAAAAILSARRRPARHRGSAALTILLLATCAVVPSAVAQLHTPSRGDLDNDLDVDVVDLAAMQARFGTATDPNSAGYDFNSDGWIDTTDWAVLLQTLTGPRDTPCDAASFQLVRFCGLSPNVPNSRGFLDLRFDAVQNVACFSISATHPAPGINLEGVLTDVELPDQPAAWVAFYPPNTMPPLNVSFTWSGQVGANSLQVLANVNPGLDSSAGGEGFAIVDVIINGQAVRYTLPDRADCRIAAGIALEPGDPECNPGFAGRVLFCAGQTHELRVCLQRLGAAGEPPVSVQWKLTGGEGFYDITPAQGTVLLRPWNGNPANTVVRKIRVTNVAFHPPDQPRAVFLELKAFMPSVCCALEDPAAAMVEFATQSLECSIGNQVFEEVGQTLPVRISFSNPCSNPVSGTWTITGPDQLYALPVSGDFANLNPGEQRVIDVPLRNLAQHGPVQTITLTVTPTAHAGPCTSQGGLTFQPPKVESIASEYTLNDFTDAQEDKYAHFLHDVARNEAFTVTVNWRGHPAGDVEFFRDGTPIAVVHADGGNVATRTFPLGAFPRAARLEARAVSADGSASKPAPSAARIIDDPLGLNVDPASSLGHDPLMPNELVYVEEVTIKPWELVADDDSFPKHLPGQGGKQWEWKPEFVGKYNVNGTGGKAAFRTDLKLGELKVIKEEGIPYAKAGRLGAKLGKIGPKTFDVQADGGVAAEVAWLLRTTPGTWSFDGGKIGSFGNIEAKVPPKPYLIWLTIPIGPFPLRIPVYIQGKVGIGMDYLFGLQGLSGLSPQGVEWTGQVSVSPRAELEAGLGAPQYVNVKAGGYFGLRADVQVARPAEPWALLGYLQQLDVVAAGGLRFALVFWEKDIPGIECKLVFLCASDCPWFRCNFPLAGSAALLDGEWQPLDRSYLGREFAVFCPLPADGLRLGQTTDESTLVANEFPQPKPEIAIIGGEPLLIWLTDDTSRAALDRTKVVFSRYDGASWSPPADIADDGTADWDPQLADLGGGDAAAAWVNLRTVLPEGAQPDPAVEDLEIAAAVYDAVAQVWGPQIDLTSNGFFEHKPRLAGSAGGTAFLVWVRNPANDPLGSGTTPNDLLYAAYDGTAWSAPAVAAADLPALINLDVAYDGTAAVVMYGSDEDGDLMTSDDGEIYALTFDGASWSGPQRLTNDLINDTNPKPVFDHNGNLRLAWYREGDLVSATRLDLGDMTIAVDRDWESANGADFVMATGADGRSLVAWSEESENFVDMAYSFFDPARSIWSEPALLTADQPSEGQLAVAFDTLGNVVGACAKQSFIFETRLVEMVDDFVEVDVPVPDHVDLNIVRHVVALDLAVNSDGIRLDPWNPGAGESVEVSAAIRNLGDFAAEQVDVAFYDGDPDAGGVLIGTNSLAPFVAGGALVNAATSWIVPAIAGPRDIHVVIDPDNEQPDVNAANDRAFRTFFTPELELFETWITHPSACARIVNLTVRNTGPLDAGPFEIALRDAASNGTLIDVVAAPGLTAGTSLQASLRWAGPVSAADSTPRLHVFVDDSDQVAETDEFDNHDFVAADLNEAGLTDCNTNGIADVCDLLVGAATDCDSNGILDECAVMPLCLVAGNACQDCQPNAVPDACDVAGSASADVNTNGVPDECEDCNTNGVVDDFDVAFGTSNDCNGNGKPDECEPDCNTNGSPDACDVWEALALDCNFDLMPDECQLAGNDCNGNGVPDDCDPDLDADGLPDDCDPDLDGDGYEGSLGDGTDCADFEPLVNPGAPETPETDSCGDGLDNDCDGLMDAADPDC